MTLKNNQLESPFTQDDKSKLDSVQEHAEANPPFATKEVAEAGLDNAQIMTALRVKQAIDVFADSSGGGAKVIEREFLNNSGATLEAFTPVRQDATGNLSLVDVSEETEVFNVLGLTVEDISDEASGKVALSGLIEDVDTAFEVGDFLYIDVDGGITNIPPEIGVNDFLEGDFIVSLGIVLKNQSNDEAKDIFLQTQVRGQL